MRTSMLQPHKLKTYQVLAVFLFLFSFIYFLRSYSTENKLVGPQSDVTSPHQPTTTTSFACPLTKPKPDQCPGRSKGRPMQFIHVPKAGGTSVQETLMKFAQNSQNIPITLHDGDGPNYNPSTTRGFFLGHRGFGFSSKIAPSNPLTIAALREPTSRIVSLFDYLRTSQEKIPVIQQVKRAWQGKSLDEVVQSYESTLNKDPNSLLPGGSASFSDRSLHRVLKSQVQFLCGYECVWYMTGDSRESLQPFENVMGEECFRRARENLEKVDAIAVLERLDDLIVQLRALNVDFLPKNFDSFPHENKVSSQERSQPSEKTLALLREWTKEEKVLYDRTRELTELRTNQAKQCLLSRNK